MPIYEYQCRKCQAHIEILQKITDKPLTKCRKCGGRLDKQWSSTSFQLKGSGWYATDYAGKKSEAGEDAKKSTTAEPSSTADVKKDTPAAKKTDSPAKPASSSGTANSGD